METHRSSTEVEAAGLIGEAAVDPERRVHEPVDALLLVDTFEFLHVLFVKLDELAIRLNTGRGHRFRENGRATGH